MYFDNLPPKKNTWVTGNAVLSVLTTVNSAGLEVVIPKGDVVFVTTIARSPTSWATSSSSFFPHRSLTSEHSPNKLHTNVHLSENPTVTPSLAKTSTNNLRVKIICIHVTIEGYIL